MDDLISRLRALSRHEHSDYSIGDEAADVLEAAGWQPIKTAPEAGAFIATGHNYDDPRHGRHYVIARRQGDFFVEASEWNEASDLDYLTHWMPLPALPKEVGNE